LNIEFVHQDPTVWEDPCGNFVVPDYQKSSCRYVLKMRLDDNPYCVNMHFI
ncbi:MAG: hypothetical protein Satyrvirus46_6, partial [Satyrvirus sp.]